ncbi:MAG TPA: protoglobin family protein [Candidatus Methylomirabilis sp.]|nr:protoglobin family protein [Candidatus Methylomirabilis sp.]
MSEVPRTHPGADMERFVKEQMAFVGLGEDDVSVIRRTAPLVLERHDALTAALYEHFLQFPETAQFFLAADGSPDRERIERRKHSLARWLRETAEVVISRGFVYYLLGVAIAHSHRDYGPGGKIPPQFMVGAMSLTQTALARLFEEQIADAREALRAATAWNKLLLVNLNVLLLGYLLPPMPARRAEGAGG